MSEKQFPAISLQIIFFDGNCIYLSSYLKYPLQVSQMRWNAKETSIRSLGLRCPQIGKNGTEIFKHVHSKLWAAVKPLFSNEIKSVGNIFLEELENKIRNKEIAVVFNKYFINIVRDVGSINDNSFLASSAIQTIL